MRPEKKKVFFDYNLHPKVARPGRITARLEGETMTKDWVIFETRADIRHCMDRLEIAPWEAIATPEGFTVNIAGWVRVSSHAVILRQSVLETLNRLYSRGRAQL